jgi:nicotinamide-nucleotide amidase
MYPHNILDLAEQVLQACRDNGLKLALAESCTGGLIAGALSTVPGSSDVLDRGFVTYANEAKTDMLGVPVDMLANHGAVSKAVARAMAEGAIRPAAVDISVSVTGIAGPGGGSAEKPVGLVHIASARTNMPTRHQRHVFEGDRQAIRLLAVQVALELLLRQANFQP